MKNIDQIIKNHNRKILNKTDNKNNTRNCNCRVPNQCPVNNECLTENVVYQATLPSGVNYIGMTSNTFKTRYNNHKQSFKSEYKKNTTTLAQYIWNNKLTPSPHIEWKILKRCSVYQPGQRNCNLCISEKQNILNNINNPHNINNRQDFGSRCNHRKKWTLKNTQSF